MKEILPTASWQQFQVFLTQRLSQLCIIKARIPASLLLRKSVTASKSQLPTFSTPTPSAIWSRRYFKPTEKALTQVNVMSIFFSN